jgi:hypothetical protein
MVSHALEPHYLEHVYLGTSEYMIMVYADNKTSFKTLL